VGLGSCGIAAGAKKTQEAIDGVLAAAESPIRAERTGCIGLCFAEPLVEVVDGDKSYFYGRVDAEKAALIAEKHILGGEVQTDLLLSDEEMSFLTRQERIALRNCGVIDPENIEHYIERGGYQALKKAVTELTPEEIIETVKISGLRGRGGAGFPTWFKWDACRKAEGDEKYIICNADEGDPGAFMDRSVLESDPHAVLEGMAIAARAIGSNQGVIYVRAEYPLSIYRLEIAMQAAREKGFLGKNIFGSGWDFDIYIKAGAGAFVCGEETALIASLEGERGMPRLKPPFPAQKGFWQKPSNINNVETLANVAWIIRHGGEAFAAYGTETSKGTKVFALAGKIKRGGLVEVPMGLTLREVIFDIGGGIKGGGEFKAVQMGGPSGGCIPASLLDTPIDYESINKTGAIMGSGGMIIMDEHTCMVDMARFFLDFTQKESCGKCIHCRIGTKRMLEILTRITKGEGRDGDIELLQNLGEEIKAGSLCGLGASAPNPALSTIRYFLDEYKAHIEQKTCPSHSCRDLLTYYIKPESCRGCSLCSRKCPVGAIDGELREVFVIDESKCIKCGNCAAVCRFNAVEVR
jgi:NADH-quinone oxidoreductase subunit F